MRSQNNDLCLGAVVEVAGVTFLWAMLPRAVAVGACPGVSEGALVGVGSAERAIRLPLSADSAAPGRSGARALEVELLAAVPVALTATALATIWAAVDASSLPLGLVELRSATTMTNSDTDVPTPMSTTAARVAPDRRPLVAAVLLFDNVLAMGSSAVVAPSFISTAGANG